MINLLITTAGGSGIYPSLEAIKTSKYKTHMKVTLVDASDIAGALYEVDSSYIIPRVDNKDFFCVLQEIIQKERINYMLSFLDEELNFLVDKQQELTALGVKTIMPPKQALLNSWDKRKTFQICKEYFPKTSLLIDTINIQEIYREFKGKLLLKPAQSRGGRGIIIPEDFEEFSFFAKKFLKNKIPYLIQELLTGDEYNITTFHDTNKNVIYAIARRKFDPRIIKSGSKASVIEENQEVVDFALEVLQKMDLERGFNNVEVIQNTKGIFLLEVNGGRIAAQDMNIVKAGINYIDIFIDCVDHKPIEKPTYEVGVCNIKTLRDIAIHYSQIEQKKREYHENINRCGSSGR